MLMLRALGHFMLLPAGRGTTASTGNNYDAHHPAVGSRAILTCSQTAVDEAVDRNKFHTTFSVPGIEPRMHSMALLRTLHHHPAAMLAALGLRASCSVPAVQRPRRHAGRPGASGRATGWTTGPGMWATGGPALCSQTLQGARAPAPGAAGKTETQSAYDTPAWVCGGLMRIKGHT